VQPLRVLMLVEAASLVGVAALHSAVLTDGRYNQAAIYEGSIAVILGIGLALTFIGPSVAWAVGIVAQAVAIAGASIGFYLAVGGIAPNSIPDIVYHVVLIALLAIGLVAAWRVRSTYARPTTTR
jgi:hypothetical protein